ncbi:MAG TPA: DUF4912 domain-containing protein [Pyrinomonadaceae bacterium]|nr:DUF4912 domain-containing protein [Pyrinomonadaceae bacterium]
MKRALRERRAFHNPNETTFSAAHMFEETNATDPLDAPVAMKRPAPLALDDTLPVLLQRDFIQLLLQSPHKLFLYWTFARDPHATLRAAFGELAARYRLAVRLVIVESGEEFLLDAPRERMQWFEVYPRHAYRADIGFHAAGHPFVRLLSSGVVSTPPDSASHLSDEEQEFQLEANEFARLLNGAGYESYARGMASAAGETKTAVQNGVVDEAQAARPVVRAVGAPRIAEANEYPHL